MGIYDDKKSISREKLQSTFKKDEGKIPGTGGRKYHQREREKMARKTFGSKYGSEISKDEYRKAVRSLEHNKRKAQTLPERLAMDRKIRYLREKGGKDL